MEEDADAAAAVIDRLSQLQAATLPRLEADVNLRQLLVGYGWWTRIVHTSQAVLAAHSAGVAHEAAPLVRALIHHSVALKWLAEFPDEATAAITWEHQRRGEETLRKALDRGWDIDPEAGPTAPTDDAPEGYRYLMSMEKLCARATMTQAFVPLLLESKFSHPTGISADAYLAGEVPNIVLVQHPDRYTPLHASAMFAAEATIQFAEIALLANLAQQATTMRDQMFEIVQRSSTDS